MKEVIISADGDRIVYLVPDAVANDLRKYCIYFCDRWIKNTPRLRNTKLRAVIAIMKRILLTI